MRGQRATVRAVYESLRIQHLQILSNRDLGGIKMPGEIANQHTAIPLQHVENRPAALFVQHLVTQMEPGAAVLNTVSFYIVCFRLSSEKKGSGRHGTPLLARFCDSFHC